MQPSAIAGTTLAGAPAKEPRRVVVAAAFPIRPKAMAAADATSVSGFFKITVNDSTAPSSRRTPIELIVPTNSRPLSESIALRNASPASGPGIASSAIRDHEASFSSLSSFANSGTAAGEPQTASSLQAIALSAPGASERSFSISSFSLAAFWLSAA